MKIRPFFTLLLLSLPLCFSLEIYAQGRNPQQDLSILVWLDTDAASNQLVTGQLKNGSTTELYACVRMEFNLHGRHPQNWLTGGPVIGTAVVELRDVQPNRVRKFAQQIPSRPRSVSRKSITDCSPAPEIQEVVLYENANFGGRQKSFGIDDHVIPLDFNDVASSIKVPKGLVAIVFEHADAGGGYGLWVDFLEDQPNLARYNLDEEISYLKIFRAKTSDGGTWVRNHKLNGEFKPGYFHMGRSQPPAYPDPVVGRKPENIKPPPVTCTVTGDVKDDEPRYKTVITLHLPNGSPTQFSATVIDRKYTIRNVPGGTYRVMGTGTYPRSTTESGKPMGLGIFSDSDQIVTCSDGQANSIAFAIRSIEG